MDVSMTICNHGDEEDILGGGDNKIEGIRVLNDLIEQSALSV